MLTTKFFCGTHWPASIEAPIEKQGKEMKTVIFERDGHGYAYRAGLYMVPVSGDMVEIDQDFPRHEALLIAESRIRANGSRPCHLLEIRGGSAW